MPGSARPDHGARDWRSARPRSRRIRARRRTGIACSAESRRPGTSGSGNSHGWKLSLRLSSLSTHAGLATYGHGLQSSESRGTARTGSRYMTRSPLWCLLAAAFLNACSSGGLPRADRRHRRRTFRTAAATAAGVGDGRQAARARRESGRMGQVRRHGSSAVRRCGSVLVGYAWAQVDHDIRIDDDSRLRHADRRWAAGSPG